MRARKPRTRSERESGRRGLLRLIVAVALVAWVVRSLIFAPFSIPSGSMLPTLLVGDYVLVAKWPYGYSRFSFPFQFPPIEERILSDLPDRGDVVVFRAPSAEGHDFIKRVIGLPGDRVEVRRGRVILNGRPVRRAALGDMALAVSPNSQCRKLTARGIAVASPGQRQCKYAAFRETLPGGGSYRVLDQVHRGPVDDFPAVQVPAGHLFLMGDNRDDSLDSRFAPAEGGIGFVPLENVVGRALTIFWSTDGSASYVEPWTWFTALRASRIGKSFSG